ncbi:hypothetical protein C884_02016 [Kocuria palustris PEL]|uniref:Uncharacterized protein n=1 Tax=Kocuria palustris PEL TaxID=1236550 RepID=M2WEY9_9MICC|nr:hypothetical protein C884_02016 [Kocuria palustris PEL]
MAEGGHGPPRGPGGSRQPTTPALARFGLRRGLRRLVVRGHRGKSRCWRSGADRAALGQPGPAWRYSSPRITRTSPTTASRAPITPMGSMIRGPPRAIPLLMTCFWNRYATTIERQPMPNRAIPKASMPGLT